MALALALHLLASTIWVGGMFFAWLILRPAAGPLAGPLRLALWRRVLARFFPWVIASIAVLLLSGYFMLFWGLGGFRGAGLHVHLMQATGLLMMALFFHLYFAPWPRFAHAVERDDWQAAATELARIRRLVAVNLTLGLLTAAIGASGRWW